MISSTFTSLIIFLSFFSKVSSLYCYDGYGEVENLGVISCFSQYCVSGILEDGTKYHTCPSNSYCSWGSGCRRTKESGEILACCCSTDYCNSGNLYNFSTYYFLFISLFLLLFNRYFIEI